MIEKFNSLAEEKDIKLALLRLCRSVQRYNSFNKAVEYSVKKYYYFYFS